MCLAAALRAYLSTRSRARAIYCFCLCRVPVVYCPVRWFGPVCGTFACVRSCAKGLPPFSVLPVDKQVAVIFLSLQTVRGIFVVGQSLVV